MNQCSKSAQPPILLVHGGAGAADLEADLLATKTTNLKNIIDTAWEEFSEDISAIDIVCRAVELLEADEHFNAGYGSVLQRDGIARMTASLMDGSKQSFSGVMLATDIIHPSKLARALQGRDNTVLAGVALEELIEELQLERKCPASTRQIERWKSAYKNLDTSHRYGTVGAVALDRDGNFAAATSTGGRRLCAPGRVSDSATVAGNYASIYGAISCTGFGEHITDDAVAARLETRLRDGLSLSDASDKMLSEAVEQSHLYAWIAIDSKNCWTITHSTKHILAAARDASMKQAVIA